MKKNPFRFGSPVEGESYFERKVLSDSCEAFLRGGMSVVLVGPRRFGKTSFAKNFCNHWQQKDYGDAILLDVYNVSSHQDFLLQMLSALQSRRNLWEKFCQWTKNLPEKLLPDSVSVEKEDVGKLTLQWLASKNDQEKKLHIKEVFESLTKLSGQLCLVIDECQQISKESLNDEGWLEATLRQYVQQQVGEVAYMLTGSRRDIVHAMVNDIRRPLYRAFNLIDFPPLDDKFTLWILERFALTETKASAEAIRYLRAQVNDSPNYVQMVCFHLIAMGYTEATIDTIDVVLANIVTQNAYSYETHLHNLSSAQQRVLRMLALESEGYFADSNLRRYEINSAAHVTMAINAMKKKNILDQEAPGRGRVSFDDPMFRLWLRYKFGGYLPGKAAEKQGLLF